MIIKFLKQIFGQEKSDLTLSFYPWEYQNIALWEIVNSKKYLDLSQFRQSTNLRTGVKYNGGVQAQVQASTCPKYQCFKGFIEPMKREFID